MVGTDAGEVERQLAAGELVCRCGEGLARWGYARSRIVRGLGRLHPRQVRCLGCRATHVSPHAACLLRRADAVEVIGAALRAKAARSGHRPIATRLDGPASTVRGWLRRFSGNAEVVRSILVGLLVELDPLHSLIRPAGTGSADAVEMVGMVAAAARGGGRVVAVAAGLGVTDGWLLVSGLAVGSANTN